MALSQFTSGLWAQIHSVLGTKQCSQRTTLVPRALKERVDLASSWLLNANTELGCGNDTYSYFGGLSLRYIKAIGFSRIKDMMVSSKSILISYITKA